MALEEKLEYQMTQEGYDKLVEELEHYKKVKRPEVIRKIKIAVVRGLIWELRVRCSKRWTRIYRAKNLRDGTNDSLCCYYRIRWKIKYNSFR